MFSGSVSGGLDFDTADVG